MPDAVLVVDDSPEDRATIRRFLSIAGMPIREVANGIDGLRACRDLLPACLLLDLDLPDLNGLEFLEQLIDGAPAPPCPVVMMTGKGTEQAAVQSLKRGAMDYLVKGTFTPETLRQAVSEAITKFAARPEVERQRVEAERLHRDARDSARVLERLVLLVDDSPEDRTAIRRYLGQDASTIYRFVEQSTGQDALEVSRSAGLDCLLLDYALPDMSGLELLDQLTGGTGVAPFPVVMLTGQGDETVAVQALKRGATDYLVKGRFTAETLRNTVDSAIQRAAVRRAEERRRIAELERLEAESRARADQLAGADRRKDEFLAMLAHELRNPLAPIRNALHVATALTGDQPEVSRALQVATRQLGLMSRLVDDLLDVSRIAHGKVRIRPELADLGEIVQSAVEAARSLLDARRHTLVWQPPTEPLLALVDADRMEQVVVNLLANAAKYTEPGGTVTVTLARQGSTIHIGVRDTGVGIPADMLGRVFDLFAQVDRSLDRAKGGLGIGLTLVRSLVELHGGRVDAHSDGPDTGSEFVIQLPAATAAVTDHAPSAVPSGAARPLRVLLVEDHVEGAEMLSTLLGLWGHEVRVATDGRAGLNAALSGWPELVLLDIGLPELDGYAVAAAIRAEALISPMILVALTGYGQAEDRERSKAAGFDHHLVKPVSPVDLERLLATCG